MRPPVNVGTPPQGPLPGVWWLLRWVLVVLLVFDQASSPLHQHQHYSGIDAQSLGTSWQAAHAEDNDHTVRAAHSLLAVRPARAACCETISATHEQLAPAPWRGAAHWRVPDSDARVVPGRTKPPPPMMGRSLPPASRAPPLHA